jgi:hypothetical protein
VFSRSENTGFPKRRKVIAKLSETPHVGREASEAGRIGSAEGIGGRVFFFADFSSRKHGKIFRKNSDSLLAMINLMPDRLCNLLLKRNRQFKHTYSSL